MVKKNPENVIMSFLLFAIVLVVAIVLPILAIDFVLGIGYPKSIAIWGLILILKKVV